MSSMMPTVPYMKAPVPFITDEYGKWEITKEAVEILEQIRIPITVVAIVGRYRTGKSFLMNRLAGKESGFALGAKAQAQTKGIWMWAKIHQNDPNTCIVLLDTEGLYDVKLDDKIRDMDIFIFSVLLSNCLVFNLVGSIDSTSIQELELVAELPENIKVKNTQKEEDESRTMFPLYFPSLFLVLRDFFLELEIDGEPITPKEYLDDALALKRGKSKSVLQYNAPREAIRDYFKRRTCFVLPKPVDDDKLLAKLDQPEVPIKKEFLEKSELAIQAILNDAKPMSLDGNIVTGSSYIHLVGMYVKCVNDGAVPCIESAIALMKKNECLKACEEALEAYKKNMDLELLDKMPMDREILGNIHISSGGIAIEVYRKRALADDSKEYAKNLEEHIEIAFQLKMSENNDRSETKSKKEVEKCFASFEDAIENGDFLDKGGHEKYMKAKDKAEKAYRQAKGLGPMRDQVLHDYLDRKRDSEKFIIKADKKLTDKEKEQEAMLREKMKQREEKRRFEEVSREELNKQMQKQQEEQTNALQKLKADNHDKFMKMLEMQRQQEEQTKALQKLKADSLVKFMKMLEMQRQQEEQTKALQKLKADNHDKFMKMLEEQGKVLEKKEGAMQKLLEQGLTRQAEEHRTQITQMKQMMDDEKINRLSDELESTKAENVKNKNEIDELKMKQCVVM